MAYSHSKTLFRLDDGTKMKFVVLRSSFDAAIVTSLIQWGGGSATISDEPVADAINLSCKTLPEIDHDIFNTSFIHASCLSNRRLDITGFFLGRNLSGKNFRSISDKDTEMTLDSESLRLPSNANDKFICSFERAGKNLGSISNKNTEMSLDSESLRLPSNENGSNQEMLMKWLNMLSGGTGQSLENDEGNKVKEDDKAVSELSSASTFILLNELERQMTDNSEILPEDSASAVRCNIVESSSESAEEEDVEKVLSLPLQETGGSSPSLSSRIKSQVDMWLQTISSDEEEM